MKVSVCLILAFVTSCSAIGFAAVAEKQKELSDLQAQLQQVNTDLKKLGLEKLDQSEQLRILEKQYGESSNALLTIKVDIKLQEEKLHDLRSKITLTQKDFQAQKHALEGLVKTAYAIGEQEGLKLILNQRDPSLSGRMLIYQDYISKARVQKLQILQENSKSLAQLEAEKVLETQALQKSLEKKQFEIDKLLALKSQREKLVLQLDNAYLSKNQQRERLLYDEKKLANLVASLQKTDDNNEPKSLTPVEIKPKQESNYQIKQKLPSKLTENDTDKFTQQTFSALQGQLTWPVQGVISEHFGNSRFETTWDGAVINAREGAEIRAIAPGRVVYADWLRGYGLMLIVDHGSGYMSLYGFNQSLHKNVGERVLAGETLASVGRSGGRAEAALYFGIRKNSRPVNPELWCRTPGKN